MKRKTINQLSSEIKKELNNDVSGLFLFGSFLENKKESSDIDLVVVIINEKEVLAIIKKINALILPYILEYGKMISCFPILKSAFDNEENQFIINVKRSGVKL